MLGINPFTLSLYYFILYIILYLGLLYIILYILYKHAKNIKNKTNVDRNLTIKPSKITLQNILSTEIDSARRAGLRFDIRYGPIWLKTLVFDDFHVLLHIVTKYMTLGQKFYNSSIFHNGSVFVFKIQDFWWNSHNFSSSI